LANDLTWLIGKDKKNIDRAAAQFDCLVVSRQKAL
jgi:hypothetical protein